VDEDISVRPDEEYTKRANEFKNERFDVFIGGVLSAMQSSLDANKYEDFARALLGSRAYLLFSFDKLITATVK
jgi:hypothetical protein